MLQLELQGAGVLHLGLETFHGQLGGAGRFLLQAHQFQCVALNTDVLLHDDQLIIEGEQLVIRVGNLGNQVGHHEIFAFYRGQVAHGRGLLRIAQLVPDVDLPGGKSAQLEVRERGGRAAVFFDVDLLLGRALQRVPAHFRHVGPGTQAHEGQVLAAAGADFVAGNFDFLQRDVQLLVVFQGRANQRLQVRVGEKLLPLQARRVGAILRSVDGGGVAGRRVAALILYHQLRRFAGANR